MDFLTIVFIAFGLSADAFAVSITNGICSSKISKKDAFAAAFTFGAFQAAMPVIGYYLGNAFSGFISSYQHFVALFLLGAIGINMIAEAAKEKKNPEEVCTDKNIFTVKNLVLQGIATSIDALAVGVSFIAIDVNLFSSALLIGCITFLCCILGVYIGKKFGTLLGLRAKLIGGALLIIIGLKIFIENQIHLMS